MTYRQAVSNFDSGAMVGATYPAINAVGDPATNGAAATRYWAFKSSDLAPTGSIETYVVCLDTT